MKHTKKQIAEEIVKITYLSTAEYMEQFNTDKFDTRQWCMLHIGFISGMKMNGYKEKFLMKALELAQKQIDEELRPKIEN